MIELLIETSTAAYRLQIITYSRANYAEVDVEWRCCVNHAASSTDKDTRQFARSRSSG